MFDYDAKIFLVNNPNSKTVAMVNLVIDGIVEVCGFKIVNGSNGLFVAAPQSKGSKKDAQTGKDIWYDDVRFLDDRTEDAKVSPKQKEIYDFILSKYNEKTGTNTRTAAAAAQQTQNKQPARKNNPLY